MGLVAGGVFMPQYKPSYEDEPDYDQIAEVAVRGNLQNLPAIIELVRGINAQVKADSEKRAENPDTN